MSVTVAKFLDVANGLQANQFSIGDRYQVDSISSLDETYKQLMDKPFACVMAVMGPGGRPNLTPMWFDYEGDKVLINVAEHRKKTDWIRANPQVSILIMNPENMYHWMSLKVTVEREIHEDDPKRALGSLSNSTESGRNTSARGSMVCVIRRSTSGACCSNAVSTG